MKTTLGSEFLRGMKQGPRLFFAPLIGAYRGTRAEWRRVAIENARYRRLQQEADATRPAGADPQEQQSPLPR
jgi:hypothetical protein